MWAVADGRRNYPCESIVGSGAGISRRHFTPGAKYGRQRLADAPNRIPETRRGPTPAWVPALCYLLSAQADSVMS
jgi:hypothetical protein